MPAIRKADLIAVTTKEFAKLDNLLGGISDRVAMAKDDSDTSIKDVVAHRAHWIDLFLGWYADGRAGKEVFFPAKGYNWSELKAYSAALRQRQARLSWPEAVGTLREAHASLLDLLTGLTDSDLYGSPMKGAKNTWVTGRWAEAAGPSHYRSAARYIRARIRALG